MGVPKLEIRNPATGEVLSELECDNNLSIIEKFNRAMAAQLDWALSELPERESVIQQFVALFKEKRIFVEKNLAEETGKPIVHAKEELDHAVEACLFYLRNYRKVLFRQREIFHKDALERLTAEPLGLVAHIASPDLPVLTALNVFVPAILTGNAVIYKPSEHASLTGLSIVDLFYEAGLSDELLIPVIGDSFAGQELLKWPFQGLFFSGAAKTGRAIIDNPSLRFTNVQMEFGGSNSAYVCEDYDVSKAARKIAAGALYHCGQSRINVSRIYVHEKNYGNFLEALRAEFRGYLPGNPLAENTRLGPLVREREGADLLEKAKSAGARVELFFENELPSNGHYVSPALILDAENDMECLQKEAMGPYAALVRVRSDVEAIHYINDSDFGLYASVFTQDEERAWQVLSNAQVGMACWNCCKKISPYLPRQARKESGLGVSMGLAGIRAFLQAKSWFLSEET